MSATTEQRIEDKIDEVRRGLREMRVANAETVEQLQRDLSDVQRELRELRALVEDIDKMMRDLMGPSARK
jgi:hypothetical protein